MRSRLLLMQACISEPACLPHNLLASFLQSCDTELLEEDEVVGADAAAGGAVCAYVFPTIAKEATSASDRTFIFISSFVCGATRKSGDANALRYSIGEFIETSPHLMLSAGAEFRRCADARNASVHKCRISKLRLSGICDLAYAALVRVPAARGKSRPSPAFGYFSIHSW